MFIFTIEIKILKHRDDYGSFLTLLKSQTCFIKIFFDHLKTYTRRICVFKIVNSNEGENLRDNFFPDHNLHFLDRLKLAFVFLFLQTF